ncbi:MAG: DUF4440 domain-containing protein [Acidobacteriota bacterium]|nr:DUF4440 domain-containing protein [Acidobacteriota bacterium]MDH3530810.1 DUF4440 domain-containing protein [Acidobacteriota bacterium]
MFVLKAALAAALLFSGVLGANGQEPALRLGDGVVMHQGIDRIYADFSKSYRTLDFVLLADLYSEDAAYLSPDDPIVTGRAEIKKNFESFFGRMKSRGRSMTISFHIVKREVNSDMGYDVGTFKIEYTEKGKPTTYGTGKFVVVTVKGTDGKWRFAVDGYNALPSSQ